MKIKLCIIFGFIIAVTGCIAVQKTIISSMIVNKVASEYTPSINESSISKIKTNTPILDFLCATSIQHSDEIISIGNVKNLINLVKTNINHGTNILFSPDNETVAISGYEEAGEIMYLYNIKTGMCRRLPKKYGYNIAFSPDGKLLAISHYDVIYILNTSDGSLLHSISIMDGGITNIAFSPNGKMFAAGSINNSIKTPIQIWDVSDWKLICYFNENTTNITFSRDNNLLIIVTENSINFRNITEGTLVLSIPEKNVNNIALSHDGKLLSSGSVINEENQYRANGVLFEVKLWSVSDGTLIRKMRNIISMDEMNNESLPKTEKILTRPINYLAGGNAPLITFSEIIAFSNDDSMIITIAKILPNARVSKLLFWNMVEGTVIHKLNNVSWDASLSADGKLLALNPSVEGPISIWGIK